MNACTPLKFQHYITPLLLPSLILPFVVSKFEYQKEVRLVGQEEFNTLPKSIFLLFQTKQKIAVVYVLYMWNLNPHPLQKIRNLDVLEPSSLKETKIQQYGFVREKD